MSKKKRRFDKDGYDLDLAYITSNIIAMAWPGDGGEGMHSDVILCLIF